MYQFKRIIALSVLVFFSVCAIYAQTFSEASKEVASKITIKEVNQLPIDRDLLCIPDAKGRLEYNGVGKIKVGKLVRNGDYSKYYKNKNLLDFTQNFWVFIPKEVKEKCTAKRIQDSRRLSRFLGLDDSVSSDTIVFLWVDKNQLFRPAYNSDISKEVKSLPSEPRSIDHPSDKVKKWFDDQCKNNTYPWTRLGYTYDWGDASNKIGATEFVTKIGYFGEFSSYLTVKEFLSNYK